MHGCHSSILYLTLAGGAEQGVLCPHTALCHPVLNASRERDRQSETGEFLLKVIQTTEWEMLGRAGVYMSGRVSAGRSFNSSRLARKAGRG